MANFSITDTSPLIMQRPLSSNARHDSAHYPEVVPVENLSSNTLRHESDWYLKPQHTSTSLPNSKDRLSPFQNGLLYPQPGLDDATIPVEGAGRTSRKKLALVCALFTFLFTALALSTGLGIPLAKCKNRLIGDNYRPLQPLQVNTVRKSNFCNSNGELTRDSIFTARNSSASFDLHCGVIFQAGLAAFDPKSTTAVPNGTVRNIAAITAYSVDDCISACVSLNTNEVNADTESPRCQSVTFIAQVQSSVNAYDGNCFLKNATVQDLNQASISKDSAVSAEVHRLRKET